MTHECWEIIKGKRKKDSVGSQKRRGMGLFGAGGDLKRSAFEHPGQPLFEERAHLLVEYGFPDIGMEWESE